MSEHLVRHARAPVLVVKHHRLKGGASQTEVNKSTEESETEKGKGLAADAKKKESDASRGNDDFLGPPEQGFAKGTR